MDVRIESLHARRFYLDVGEQDVRAILELHTRLGDIDMAELAAAAAGAPGGCLLRFWQHCVINCEDLMGNLERQVCTMPVLRTTPGQHFALISCRNCDLDLAHT